MQPTLEVRETSCTAAATVDVPLARAFQVYRDDRATWFGTDLESLGAWTAETDELPWRWVQDMDHPLVGSIHLEAAFAPEGDAATRVTVTLSGFDLDSLERGITESSGWAQRESLADFAAWVEHGVAVPRHISFRCSLGFNIVSDAAGARVVRVNPGSYGEAVGLEVGDVLTHLDGAASYGTREVLAVMRRHDPGDLVEARWIRGGELHAASAATGSFWGSAAPATASGS
jgi:hypothetical protein